ncbi:MAG: condensation domain-containing protein, partial [Psychrosphaera sp.]|nr:condensation domain-containing protein [Psychrosphaera sp.]
VVEDWPLTPNGKVDRKALPTSDDNVLQGEYIAPSTDTEKVLADIWSQLLEIDASMISATANFFDLRGHSLLCMRLVSEIRARCNVEVSVQNVFEHSTLNALARVVDQGSQGVVRPVLLAIERDGDKMPVSYTQQRLWFIDRMQGGTPEYNLPMAFEVTGQFNTALVTAVFNTIIERHEILRTVYLDEGQQTLQHIYSLSAIDFAVKEHDLSHLTGEALAGQVKMLVETDIVTPFDLTSDLMLRVSYVKKTAQSGVLIFNMHHIASDGWSMEVLTKEFFALYEAYSENKPNPLPPLAVQYVDYAYWQRDYLSGKVLDVQLDYWTQQLNELPAVHSLPLDYPRPQIKGHDGATITA